MCTVSRKHVCCHASHSLSLCSSAQKLAPYPYPKERRLNCPLRGGLHTALRRRGEQQGKERERACARLVSRPVPLLRSSASVLLRLPIRYRSRRSNREREAASAEKGGGRDAGRATAAATDELLHSCSCIDWRRRQERERRGEERRTRLGSHGRMSADARQSKASKRRRRSPRVSR